MDEKLFLEEIKEIDLLNQSLGLLEWDAQTGMPDASSSFRGETVGYINKLAFEKSTGPVIQEAVAYFTEHPDELSQTGAEVFKEVKEDYERNHSIAPERMQAYHAEVSNAHAAWLKAREEKDFSVMKDTIGRLIDFLNEFIPHWQKDEKTPYDVLLNQYEPELTVERLDQLFSELKTGILSIRKAIAEKGMAPRTDFLSRHVSKEQQKRFVVEVAKQLGYDFAKGRLDDTVHPFMLDLNRNDARITTCWDEMNFTMAVFGVIHEAGHGIYEQNIDPKYDYTPLSTGASMGIHESQSLFNEIIIGSNKSFWEKQFPLFQKCTDGLFDDIDFEMFYKGLKETKASLIRIEADSLTYPLHIIIRYEIEKMIFNEGLSLDELPTIWADKYEEYLGIRPENDLEGILQDVHWSGGSFGYFPSYAMGYMYAAQLNHALRKEVAVDEVLLSEDYSPIYHWMTEKIHRFGASKKPNELILAATGEELKSTYLVEYMKSVYFDVYRISEQSQS
ncbi:carboxypeptidase M32 [Enterococcus sp. BWB1-3]|uniref:carboxypeptidase M32 n=1 Tax=Enterococcus sp. BWB1-3 TaxID=2787713 RepID=UPI0019223070|nr:carboxypeptidase M32 [Enterococcus sp. BWB1-3]MBL1228428.1 carboxypeptidase M32 [Enterococcus sp. BWB1-3]